MIVHKPTPVRIEMLEKMHIPVAIRDCAIDVHEGSDSEAVVVGER
jgi:hypothetical protein